MLLHKLLGFICVLVFVMTFGSFSFEMHFLVCSMDTDKAGSSILEMSFLECWRVVIKMIKKVSL